MLKEFHNVRHPGSESSTEPTYTKGKLAHVTPRLFLLRTLCFSLKTCACEVRAEVRAREEAQAFALQR